MRYTLLLFAAVLQGSVVPISGLQPNGYSEPIGSPDDQQITLDQLLTNSISFPWDNVTMNPAGDLIGYEVGGHTTWAPLKTEWDVPDYGFYTPPPVTQVLPPYTPTVPVAATPEPFESVAVVCLIGLALGVGFRKTVKTCGI